MVVGHGGGTGCDDQACWWSWTWGWWWNFVDVGGGDVGCVWWFGLSFFFVAPFSLLAVFASASAFNQNVSTWNTGAVTNMAFSKCTLSSSLLATAPSILWCVVEYIRHLEVRRVTRLTHSVLVFGCGLKRDLGVVVCVVGLVFLFSLLHPSLFLQCFMGHLRSIRTCRTGIQGR